MDTVESRISVRSTFFLEDRRWRLDLTKDRRDSDSIDKPAGGHTPSLEDAVVGLEGIGPLVAHIATTSGTIRCQLLEALVPRTVALFVGLARGRLASRRYLADGSLSETWTRRRFFDGLRFHRALKGALIQSGDPTGSGTGHAGFQVQDELHPDVRHDRPGVLSMATVGANTASSQWLIALQPRPAFDDRQVAFGRCRDLAVITRVSGEPANTVVIKRLEIRRGW